MQKKVKMGSEVIINQIPCDVNMSELYVATNLLKSEGFAGCYAIVAEFKQIRGNKLLGMLGHYDPSNIFLFERDFTYAVLYLMNEHHYLLNRMFVCYKNTSDGIFLNAALDRAKLIVKYYNATFIEYADTIKKGLNLYYLVQQRFFTFDKDHSFVTGR